MGWVSSEVTVSLLRDMRWLRVFVQQAVKLFRCNKFNRHVTWYIDALLAHITNFEL